MRHPIAAAAGVAGAGSGARADRRPMEGDKAQPSEPSLVDLARALNVSIDELPGMKPVTATITPKVARLLQCLQKVAELLPADQQALLKLVDALYANHQRA